MNQVPLAYTIPQAAEVANIPETKLWQATRDHLLVTFKIGRSRRVSDTALREFIRRLDSKEIEIAKQTCAGDSHAK